MDKIPFDWSCPFQPDAQLSGDARTILDAAQAYCWDRLGSGILEAFCDEKSDRANFRELGRL